MAITSNNAPSTDTKENEEFSLPKFFAKLFTLLADLCKKAADKESEKGEDKNKPAYLAERFFEYLFSSVGFVIEHVVSWIINPKSIVNDFQAVVDFFTDLGQKLSNWWDEITGKKPKVVDTPKPNIIAEQTINKEPTPNKKEIESCSTLLLTKSLGHYQQPAAELETAPAINIEKVSQKVNAAPDVELKSSAVSTLKLAR